jgi:hypothetical protein
MEQQRSISDLPLEYRFAEEANRLREEIKLLPPGPVRDELTRRLRQAETGAYMSERLPSPGLRDPKQ